MQIRAIRPTEAETVSHLLPANSWERRVAAVEDCPALLARSPVADGR